MHGCKEAIASHGHQCVGVGADEDDGSPTFTYTVGLTETDAHPELLVVGLPPRLAHSLIENVVDLIRDGRSICDGAQLDGIIMGHPVLIQGVDLNDCCLHFGVSDAHYDAEVARLQIIWPDPQGLFLDDPGCDEGIAAVQDISF